MQTCEHYLLAQKLRAALNFFHENGDIELGIQCEIMYLRAQLYLAEMDGMAETVAEWERDGTVKQVKKGATK